MQTSTCGDVGVILTATDVGLGSRIWGSLSPGGGPCLLPCLSPKVLGVHPILWRNRGDFLTIKKRSVCFD